tara:strand:+ start:350 stop:559 length:210 start_codon:yes stop_codon:yes gene_type:complete
MSTDTKMKIGDRVRMAPMWKHKEAIGTIIKISKGYTVVSWDEVNGEWHYTEKQAKRLEIFDDQNECKNR